MIEYILNEPNWIILTAIGGIFGYLFPFIANFISFLYRYFFTKHYLTGKWNCYYIAWENNKSILKQEIWNIKMGVSSKLKVIVSTQVEGDLSYEGKIVEERGQIIVSLNAKEYNEQVFIRYPIPIPTNDSTVVGLWLGVDFNGKAMVGVNILSRIDLEVADIIDRLKDFTEIDPTNGILRLKY